MSNEESSNNILPEEKVEADDLVETELDFNYSKKYSYQVSANDLDAINVDVEPGSLQEEPGSLQEEPGLLQEEPGSLQEEPGSLQEEPGLLQKEPDQFQEAQIPFQESPSKDLQLSNTSLTKKPFSNNGLVININNAPRERLLSKVFRKQEDRTVEDLKKDIRMVTNINVVLI